MTFSRENINHGDFVKIKDESHWKYSKEAGPKEVYVDGKKFISQFDIAMTSMPAQIGKVIEVEFASKKHFFESIDEWRWDYNAIEKILTPETDPEYFV